MPSMIPQEVTYCLLWIPQTYHAMSSPWFSGSKLHTSVLAATLCTFCLQPHPIINKLSILIALYQFCSYPAQICDSNHNELPTVSANHPSRLRNNV